MGTSLWEQIFDITPKGLGIPRRVKICADYKIITFLFQPSDIMKSMAISAKLKKHYQKQKWTKQNNKVPQRFV